MLDLLRPYVTMLREPLAAATVATGALALALATYVVVKAPARPISKLGGRGLKRQRALARGGSFATWEPVLRWGGTRLGKLLPESVWTTLDRRLTRAGDYLGLSPEEYVVLALGVSLAGAGMGLLYGSWYDATGVGVLAGAVLGALVVQSSVDRATSKRAREITCGLPYVIDLLALSMTAGLDFPGAVRNVVERSSLADDGLTEELERILHELTLGHTRKHALLLFADRTGIPSAISFVQAVVQAEQRGNPLVDVLTIQAHVARQNRSAQAEVNAAKAEQAMALPLMLLAASTLVLMIVPMLIKVLASFRGLS